MQNLDSIVMDVLQKYGAQIWMSFIALFVSGLLMLWIKSFITDVFNYFQTRMSDLGYGVMILWNGKLKRVVSIGFRQIKVMDDEEILFIPIESWIKSVQAFPQPRYDAFDENKLKEKQWDGRSDRRKNRTQDGENS